MPRIVTEELINNLGPIEQLIALDYIKTGHWILEKKPGKGTPDGNHRLQQTEGGSNG